MSSDPSNRPGYDRLRDRRTLRFDRREFLTYIGATLAATACGDTAGPDEPARGYPSIDADPDVPSTPAPAAPDVPDNPFQLGVACGDPLPDGFMLWTRLAPKPVEGGAMPDRRVPIIWEIARDPQFDDLAGRNWVYARPELAHSVHVDVRGLPSDRWYWYRFRVGDQWTSPTGRARTFPAPDARPDQLRIATASCQNYIDGYYTAHEHLAREQIDAVVFLGDYIYEYGRGGDDTVRNHRGPRLRTLEQFRQRYGLYKSDPNLRAAHENCPWILTWDDHEVQNNYAGLEPSFGDPDDFKRIRAAAYQAYYEHMPIRVPFPEDPTSLRIYRSLQFGDLVRLNVLDGRQYRSGVICSGDIEAPCDEAFSADETMLGDEQESWLVDRLETSETVWNAICQQTVLAPVNLDNSIINPDMWDGYQHERQALLDTIGSDRVSNVTVLTGDIHSAGMAELPADADNPNEAAKIGHEIVATSITSGNSVLGGSGDITDLIQNRLEYVRYFNGGKRGYCVVEYSREKCRIWYRAVSSVEKRRADLTTDRAFEIDAETGELTDLAT